MPRHGGIVRNLLVLGSTVAVAAAGTGVANAEISFGNSEMVIIDSVKVSPPVLTTYSKCAAAVHNQMPVVPVTVVASFITSDGSEPVGPYGGLEDWSGGLVSAPDDHYGTDVGSNPTQFFHVTAKAAYPYWHGAGGYTFDAFAQDVGLAGGYAEVERGFSLPGLPPGGGGAVVKCPFAHPFSLGNVLSDMAKSGAEEALGAVCEACKAWYDGVKHVMYYNDLFNSVLKNSIVDDPPDANYQQIVTPQPAPVLAAPAGETTDQQSTLINLETALASDIGLSRALMTTENRAWGALNAADRYWYLKQLEEQATLADQLADDLGGIDQLYADFQAAFAPSIPAFSITPSDVTKYQVDSYAGLMPDEADVLSQLGATTLDENQIIDAIVSADALKISAADGVNALFGQNDAALVSPLRGMASWARDAAKTPPPMVADVSPRTISPGGGTQVTITGTNLSTISSVAFGPSTPTSGLGTQLACVSDSQCTTYAPPGHGTVDVVAIGPGGPSPLVPEDRVSYVTPAKPQVDHVYPSSGPVPGNTNVSITGTGLSDGIVYFGPTPSQSSRCTDTSCTAYSPSSAAADTVDVQVSTDGGISDTSPADQFTYTSGTPPPPAAPVVTAVSPSSGSNLGGETVTISGSNFSNASTVRFGDNDNSPSFQVVDDSTIKAVVPSDYQAETVDIQVFGPGGASTLGPADQFSYVVAEPTITSISPSSGSDLGGTPVTITGSNLGYGDADLYIGNDWITDATCSDTSCTGTAPPGPDGPADVEIYTNNGHAVLPGGFTYTPGPLPVVTRVSPDTGVVTGGTSVVVTGTNLITGQVSFGGVPADDQSCTDTACVATAPAADKPAAVDVQVTTNAGTSAVTPADVYSYVHIAEPVVESVTPARGYQAGFDDVHIAGTNLLDGVVRFGDVEAQGTCTMTGCDVRSPAGAGLGPVVVTVTTSSGPSSSAPSAANEFTYIAPVVTSISPSTGWTAGGTTLTIHGTDLGGSPDEPLDDVNIEFGSSGAEGTCTGATCTVVTPRVDDTVGAVDVQVRSMFGTESAPTPADVFTYFPRPVPTVTNVSPDTGTDRGGDRVTVTGTDLDGGAVFFGGRQANATCQHTSCTATTPTPPNSADGTYDVTVRTPAGTSPTSSSDQFTYAPPAAPTVTGIAPATGTILGGTSVTISGTSLTGASVTFGGKGATVNSCAYDTCTVTTPSQSAAGDVPVVVTTHGMSTGGGTASTTYTYAVPPAPVVSRVSPDTGPASGGTPITITGTDLDGGSVSIAGVAATRVTCHPTTCTAMTPAATAGVADVTVTTPGGTSAASAADSFTYSPVTITEHAIPGVSLGTGGGGIARAPDGDIWFAMPNNDKIGRISAADHGVSTYDAVPPTSGSGTASPNAITPGPDGRMWYAERNTDVLVAIDNAGNQQSYQLTGSAGDPGGSVGDLRFVTAGPDGRMWFTLGYSGAVGALDPATGDVVEYHLPNPFVLPYNIVTGPDGRLWFTEVYGDSVGAITTDGQITEYPTPVPASWDWGLTVGPDDRLWIGETMARDVAAITTDGVVTSYPVPNELDDPQGVIAGADGRIWFTAPDHDTINALDPSTGAVTEYAMPQGYPVGEAPRYLAMDTDGTLWVTENQGAHVLSVSGIADPSAAPAVTTVSPDHGAAGDTVTVFGAQLGEASAVSFGGVSATSFTVDDPAHVTAVVPAGSGTVDVTVTTPAGTSATSADDAFRYGTSSPSPPVVSGVSPASGPVAGGTVVTVTGRRMSGGTVAFGGAAADGASCTSTSCTATAPPGAAGPVDVTVTTGAGTSATGDADRFVYLTPPPGAPTVTGVSPASGPDTGGTAVTITGTSLSGATVMFGLEAAGDADCTATSCTVTSPAGGAGPVDVRVTTPGGTSARVAADRFSYVATTKTPIDVTVTPTEASFGYSSESVSFNAALSRPVAGDLQIYVDGDPVGPATHNDTGNEWISTSYFAGPSQGTYFGVGDHDVSAVFTPTDSDYYAVSTGTTSFTVTQASTHVTVGTYTASPTDGQTIGVYANVSPYNAAGTVQFADGTTPIGDPVPVSSGYATLYHAFAKGAHTVHAVFTPTDSTDYAGSEGSFTLSVAGAPVDVSSMSIAAPSAASYGAKVTVSTTLSDVTSGARLGAASVKLYRRASSKASWRLVSTRTTSSTGVARVSFAATANQQLQWRYAGDASHGADASTVRTMTVRQVVSVATTRSRIRHGRLFKLYGWVKPSGSSQRIYLQQKIGTRWKNVTSVVLRRQRLPNGVTKVGYVFPRKIARKGKVTYRIYKPRTSTLAYGRSRTLTITIT